MKLVDYHQVQITGVGKRTILFSHGFGCNQTMFRYLVADFQKDFRCVTYNLAGTGTTNPQLYRRERYQTLEGYADDAIAVCDTLGLRDVIHVGHSVSSMIAAIAARKRPELFASLVMIGPSPRYINDGDYFGGFTEQDIEDLLATMESNYLGWSAQMAPTIMGNAERPALGGELTERFCEVDPDIARYFARVTFTSDNREDLAHITQPTLILQCSDDIIASEAVGRYVHENTPNSEFVMLDARGHCPNLSAPGPTIAAIRKFLARQAEPKTQPA